MNDFQLTGIESPHENDVLSGRGNHVNSHPGNRRFRTYVQGQKKLYDQTPKSEKPIFAKLIVTTIRNLVPPGRFLKQDPSTGLWSDIGDRKAWDKTRQALREKISTDSTYPSPPLGAMTELLPNDTTSPTVATSSAMHLRSMLDRQLEVAALYRRAENNMMIYGVPQHSSALPVGSTVGNQYISSPTLEENRGGSLNATVKEFAHKNNTTASPDNAPLTSSNVISNDHRPRIKDAALNHDNRLVSGFNVSNDNRSPSSNNKMIDYDSGLNHPDYSGRSEKWGTELVTPLHGENPLNLLSSENDNSPSFANNVKEPNINKDVNDGKALSPGKRSSLKTRLRYSDSSGSQNTGSNTGVSFSKTSENGDNIAMNANKNSLQNDEMTRPRLEDKELSGLTFTSISTSTKDLNEKTIASAGDRRKSISVNDMMLNISAEKLLRSSILTNDHKDLSFGSTKIDDEIMSNRSKRHSLVLMRKKSSLSNLDDLSGLSGRMSICENMSLADSGLFSMSGNEFADWARKAAEWEREAEMEERLCQETAEGDVMMEDISFRMSESSLGKKM